jgi:hypothetical protein
MEEVFCLRMNGAPNFFLGALNHVHWVVRRMFSHVSLAQLSFCAAATLPSVQMRNAVPRHAVDFITVFMKSNP